MKKKQTICSTRRWHMWWTRGKKDGMCGIYQDVGQIPKIYREAYNAGHAYGMVSREVGISGRIVFCD